MGKLGKISTIRRDYNSNLQTLQSGLAAKGMTRIPGTGVFKYPYKELDGKYRTDSRWCLYLEARGMRFSFFFLIFLTFLDSCLYFAFNIILFSFFSRIFWSILMLFFDNMSLYYSTASRTSTITGISSTTVHKCNDSYFWMSTSHR